MKYKFHTFDFGCSFWHHKNIHSSSKKNWKPKCRHFMRFYPFCSIAEILFWNTNNILALIPEILSKIMQSWCIWIICIEAAAFVFQWFDSEQPKLKCQNYCWHCYVHQLYLCQQDCVVLWKYFCQNLCLIRDF